MQLLVLNSMPFTAANMVISTIENRSLPYELEVADAFKTLGPHVGDGVVEIAQSATHHRFKRGFEKSL